MTAPVVHGPAQLPDLRLWLAEQWAPGRAFFRAAAPYHADRGRAMVGRPPDPAMVANYAQHEQVKLTQATLWWVAEPMVDLLLAAAAGIPDDTYVHDLPPMPAAGLVVFAKPWWGIDGNTDAHMVTVDAMAWGPVGSPLPRRGAPLRPAIAISTYRAVDFAAGMTPSELQLAAETGALNHGLHHPVPNDPEHQEQARRLAERAADRNDEVARYGAAAAVDPDHPERGTFAIMRGGRPFSVHGHSWVPLGRSDWPVADPLGSAPYADLADQATLSMVEDRKVLAAMWHLLHQEGIAQQSVHAPERQAARRTQRAGIDRKLAEVQVVTLRKLHRTESAPADDDHQAHRDWSHRWLVAGHWRWARVGKGRTERRLTYVRPHVKGPEHLPLRVPTRVNAWQR